MKAYTFTETEVYPIVARQSTTISGKGEELRRIVRRILTKKAGLKPFAVPVFDARGDHQGPNAQEWYSAASRTIVS